MQSLKVADFMNCHPVVLTHNMTVAEVVERLITQRNPGAPVVDEQHCLVGFISEQDCLKQMLESGYYREQAARAKDVMRTDVLSVKPYSSVLDVAEQMLLPKPKVYPVVDDEGRLVGCISRADVLRAIDLHLRDGYKQAV